MQELILVDESDRPIGFAEKLSVHRNGGQLHRAFSIFIFNGSGELLLQRRADGCDHFGGLWANSCCGHPCRGESTSDAARRRLREELGFDVELREAFAFRYTAHDVRSDLTEQEYDHVLLGSFDGAPRSAREVVAEVKWASLADISAELSVRPGNYAPWFPIAFPKVVEFLQVENRKNFGEQMT